MIRLSLCKPFPANADTTPLSLTLEQRVKARLRVTLDDGREAGLFLERGQALHDGDCLAGEHGERVHVVAAAEPVSTVHANDPLLLTRAAYHLGNRHVALQVGDGWLRYQPDHVLDDMVRGLGLQVESEQAPFEPEPGAYGHHHHAASTEKPAQSPTHYSSMRPLS